MNSKYRGLTIRAACGISAFLAGSLMMGQGVSITINEQNEQIRTFEANPIVIQYRKAFNTMYELQQPGDPNPEFLTYGPTHIRPSIEQTLEGSIKEQASNRAIELIQSDIQEIRKQYPVEYVYASAGRILAENENSGNNLCLTGLLVSVLGMGFLGTAVREFSDKLKEKEFG